ncbi:MAG: hypothetical protein LBV80_03390 [Deltaproteobacteria bacterium]|jgi:hypothetical protein|nr:hypothetical protein [Deltaproteobacteria bacterium]
MLAEASGEAPHSLQLLDQAIALAEREFLLLEQEDCADLKESAQSRQELIEKAWEAKSGCTDADLEAMLDKLRKLKALQDNLEALATRRHAQTRDELNNRRQASRALSSYGHKLRRTLQPMMITKNS